MMHEDFDTTDCDEIVARLWPYLDGALPESARGGIVEHLRGCSACKSHFDFAQAFLDAVAEARPQGARSDHAIRARVMAALVAEGFSA